LTAVSSTGDALQSDSAGADWQGKTEGGDSKGKSQGYHGRHHHTFYKLEIWTTAKFTGRCEALSGHVCDCLDARQTNLYMSTLKEIGVYVGTNYKYGGCKAGH
jgi:hypothetical protein